MSDHVLELDQPAFETIIKETQTPVLLYFTAPWCGPCKALSPIVDEVAEAYSDKVKFIKVDIDQMPEIAKKYGVRGVPNLQIVQDGEVAVPLGHSVRTRDGLSNALNGALEGQDMAELVRDNLNDKDLREAFFISAPIEEVEAFIKTYPHVIDEKLSHDKSPVRQFILYRKFDRIELFKAHGAKLTLVELIAAELTDEAIQVIRDNADGLSDLLGEDIAAIEIAVRRNLRAVLQAIAEAGFDYNKLNPSQRLVLYRAICHGSMRDVKILDYLMDEFGLDPALETEYGLSLFHVAYTNQAKILQDALIERGFTPNSE